MRVVVVLTARPSWAKLEPVCRALKARGVDPQIVVCASALLERYGNVAAVVEQQGYTIIERVYSVFEGATLETSGLETSELMKALTRTYARLKPDLVVVCADRHEVLAAASAARHMELPVLHLQGGERSGSIDDDIRDMVTLNARYHCVCTEQARLNVYGLTKGALERIWLTGCPSIDLARQALSEAPVTLGELGGAGAAIDLGRPFLVVLQHPVTNEMADAGRQMRITLGAVDGHQAIVFFPGEDAGADAMSKEIRLWQSDVHTVRSLPPVRFLRLLTQAACLVGNSSAGIRESSYLGVPVVDIGTRQRDREIRRGGNVRRAPHDSRHIEAVIDQQIAHGPYPSASLYGSGNAGAQIAEVIIGQCTGADTGSRKLQGRPGKEHQAIGRLVADEPRDSGV